MADQYISLDNVRFIIHDVHNISGSLNYDRFEDYDKETVDIFLDAAKDLADAELFPYFAELDEHGVKYEDGKIHCHPQVGVIMKKAAELGWIGASFDYEHGGSQMPSMLLNAANHIIQAANNSATGYVGLTSGAAHLIANFGSAELYKKYSPKMLTGEWAGTMALTEPQSGSSLSDIKTSAKPNDDGSYSIKGQKIFISGGDHEYCDNFIHLTLARIEGAPKGTKGISLFVVPKKRIKPDGSLESNDLITAGEFQKMGQKGYVTTHLVYGENDDCQGWLVGAPNMGLKYMFQMMNGARIDVGLTAASTATAAYYASLQYAKERPQGRKLSKDGTKDVSKAQTLIINHPDVRRMLWLQKSICEGSTSLLMYCSQLHDISIAADEEEKKNAELLLEILTPIAKTYPSEMGMISISNGLQVLGGYGFTMDFPLQQYYRDIRIMSLYEGTTGIQSLDLMGRKMTMANGEATRLLIKEILSTIKKANASNQFEKQANQLKEGITKTQEVFAHLLQYAMKGNHELFLADATIFMEVMSTLVIAWQWLKMGLVANEILDSGQLKYDEKFYKSKIHTMKFFFNYELPKIEGSFKTLLSEEQLTVVQEEELLS